MLFLFSFNVVSAVMVISISHQNRQETIKQEKIMEQRDALDVEWRHLLLEERALSEHYRVERLANEKLKMKRPTTDDEIFVKWP
ncbi:cell division protein FtsL [Algicola sagamiensis]|uniref:cell division protein FtsL n=1 Tax=Algicola sagamiensis TaxID=163869 RepID=UPI001FE18FEA|nr:cell division protein FtsL [Algicola sagamiensis]